MVVSTAVGILQPHIKPGELALLDQFIDRTTKRASTFYDGAPTSPFGVCHIPMPEPFCAETRETVLGVASELGLRMHETATVVCIEGPRFSSRAVLRAHMLTLYRLTVPRVLRCRRFKSMPRRRSCCFSRFLPKLTPIFLRFFLVSVRLVVAIGSRAPRVACAADSVARWHMQPSRFPRVRSRPRGSPCCAAPTWR